MIGANRSAKTAGVAKLDGRPANDFELKLTCPTMSASKPVSRGKPVDLSALVALAAAVLSSGCGGEGAGSTPVSLPSPAPTGPGAPAIDEPGGIPSGFRLAWSDEFDVDGAPAS